MDIGSILILLALLLLIGVYIARPIIEHKGKIVSQEEHEFSSLLAERDRTLNALQELDFDHALGKIPEEDYPVQRTLMLKYGAEILRKLDSYSSQPAFEKAEDRLEQAINARRTIREPAAVGGTVENGNGGNSIIHPDDNLEAMISERRRNRKEKASGFCHQCGSPLQQSDLFCPRCGVKIS